MDTSSARAQQQREDWAASPIPPVWTHSPAKHGVSSVDPAAHSRVRALPEHQTRYFASDNQELERIWESRGDGKEFDAASGEDNQEDDVCTELKALPLLPLVAPEPRRVVSPELIFSSAAESLSRHKRLRFSGPSATIDKDYGSSPTSFAHFRSIVADRPDVEITSPPKRSANPVVMDLRFQSMTKQRDVPVQPFYPRATRRFPPRS